MLERKAQIKEMEIPNILTLLFIYLFFLFLFFCFFVLFCFFIFLQQHGNIIKSNNKTKQQQQQQKKQLHESIIKITVVKIHAHTEKKTCKKKKK